MKDEIQRSYRFHILTNVAISGLITGIVEMFAVINLSMIGNFFYQNGYQGGIFDFTGYNQLFWVGLMIIAGIIIFCTCFMLLEESTMRYIGELSRAMKQISSGDLNTVVEVKDDNEFSEMASDLNRLAENLRDLIEREREAERTKNELITNVAHDLRTPLTSIIGYLELLSVPNSAISAEKKLEYTQIACNKAKRLEKLIEDLFGFTKLNYGKIAMRLGKLDIIKLLSQMLEEFYPSFCEKQLTYELRASVDSLMILADGNLLARLFENLIANAIKYGEDGKKIIIYVKQEGKMVSVSVVNYGLVIPADELPQIFDKFYRVEQSRAVKTGGTGLGLAIAKNIVTMHGGTIEARSDLDGTVFEVKLPLEVDMEKVPFEKVEK